METPIYLKDTEDMAWPDDTLFYMVTSDGLMKCRNTPFFRSCVKAESAPAELEPQKPFLKLRYPKIPQELLEQVVGFFSAIQKKYDSEAYVCLVWNKETKAYEVVCPPQDISGGHVNYEMPQLPPHLMMVGDIHSHVNMSAFASGTDEHDEEHRPGVHLVVGRISQEPPEFHIEAVVDGARFGVAEELMIEKYEKRADFPEEWMEVVSKKVTTWGGTGRGNYVHPHGTVGGFNQARGYKGAENSWTGIAPGHEDDGGPID